MVSDQAYLFLIFTVNGIIISLLFDLFRISRRTFKTNDIITYIEDIIFWILTGFIILYSSFTFNNGEIRFFMFIAILFGTLIYMLFISSHIIKINVFIITILKRFVIKIINILFAPFKKIFRYVRRKLIKPIKFLIINIRKSSTNLLKKTHNNFNKSKKEKIL